MFCSKKMVVSALAVITFAIPTIGANVSTPIKADASICDLYTNSATSVLTISDSKAICSSSASGVSGVTTKIIMNQTLQKKKSSGSWGIVQAWSSTVNGSQAKVTKKSDSSLSAGTYRLKTVFIVYSGAKSETITKYSSTKTVK